MTIETGPSGHEVGPGRLRWVRPILGGAAAMTLLIGAVTVFGHEGAPGDPLWRVQTLPVIKPMPVARAPLPTPRPPQPRLRQARGHEPAATRPY